VTTELNLILLGAPGAGKGTQAPLLCNDLGLEAVSTGNLLREHQKAGSALGRLAGAYLRSGRLVPDDVVIAMVRDRIGRVPSAGRVFDGFPRTVPQAEALDQALAARERRLTGALFLDIPDAIVIERLAGRRQCARGHVYHSVANPPLRDGVCDVDGEPLLQRPDDAEATVRERLRIYRESTEPLLDHYDARGQVRRVDGTAVPSAVHRALIAAVDALVSVNA
jgi:adenylate kinase